MFALQTPPPNESVLRCDRHSGFTLHFAEPWLDVVPGASTVTVITDTACYAFDAVVLATGFRVELASRPELARLHNRVLPWRDRVLPRKRRGTRRRRAFLIPAAASSSSNPLPVRRPASATSIASIGASR